MNARFFLDTNILVRRPNRSRRDQGSMQSPLQRRPPARTAIRQPTGREPFLVTAPGLAACPGFVGASQGCVVKTRAACLRMFVRGSTAGLPRRVGVSAVNSGRRASRARRLWYVSGAESGGFTHVFCVADRPPWRDQTPAGPSRELLSPRLP